MKINELIKSMAKWISIEKHVVVNCLKLIVKGDDKKRNN